MRGGGRLLRHVLQRGIPTSSVPLRNADIQVLMDVRNAEFCSVSKNDQNGKVTTECETMKDSNGEIVIPEEPTNCCMSGCANCVWIEYAKQLETIFCGSNEKVREIILSKISDTNMRAFLEMELKMMGKD